MVGVHNHHDSRVRDRFPTTTEGRIAGVALMGGIALVGTITAALASWFVEHIGSVERANAETQDEVASLMAELKAIRTELAADKDTSQSAS